MNAARRRFLRWAAGAAASPLVLRTAGAQAYPSRFIRMIVPFPPGGAGDAIARPLAQQLSEIWGQQVVIENKGGAGGNLGAYAAANSPPDGYSILLGGPFLSINPTLYATSTYNSLTDFAAVSLICVIPNLMMVPNSSPAKSVKDFIELAKANPGKMSLASTGIGASPHLSGELFKRMAGLQMTHVPYRGAGPAMNDLIPGRVDVMFSNLPGVLPQVRGGAVRGLAVTSAKRSPAAPDIPTIGETVPGFEVSAWWGLFVPAGTPPEIIARINSATRTAVVHPFVKSKLEEIGAPPEPSTPEELATLLKVDMEKWRPIIRELGIKME